MAQSRSSVIVRKPDVRGQLNSGYYDSWPDSSLNRPIPRPPIISYPGQSRSFDCEDDRPPKHDHYSRQPTEERAQYGQTYPRAAVAEMLESRMRNMSESSTPPKDERYPPYGNQSETSGDMYGTVPTRALNPLYPLIRHTRSSMDHAPGQSDERSQHAREDMVSPPYYGQQPHQSVISRHHQVREDGSSPALGRNAGGMMSGQQQQQHQQQQGGRRAMYGGYQDNFNNMHGNRPRMHRQMNGMNSTGGYPSQDGFQQRNANSPTKGFRFSGGGQAHPHQSVDANSCEYSNLPVFPGQAQLLVAPEPQLSGSLQDSAKTNLSDRDSIAASPPVRVGEAPNNAFNHMNNVEGNDRIQMGGANMAANVGDPQNRYQPQQEEKQGGFQDPSGFRQMNFGQHSNQRSVISSPAFGTAAGSGQPSVSSTHQTSMAFHQQQQAPVTQSSEAAQPHSTNFGRVSTSGAGELCSSSSGPREMLSPFAQRTSTSSETGPSQGVQPESSMGRPQSQQSSHSGYQPPNDALRTSCHSEQTSVQIKVEVDSEDRPGSGPKGFVDNSLSNFDMAQSLPFGDYIKEEDDSSLGFGLSNFGNLDVKKYLGNCSQGPEMARQQGHSPFLNHGDHMSQDSFPRTPDKRMSMDVADDMYKDDVDRRSSVSESNYGDESRLYIPPHALPLPRKRRRKGAELNEPGDRRPISTCNVCGDRAIAHMHYGGICCYSCKAFFRRAVQSGKDRKYICKGEGNCSVSVTNRRGCQKCRFEKCRTIGMMPSWVLSDEQCEMRFGKSRLARKRGYGTSKKEEDVKETEESMSMDIPESLPKPEEKKPEPPTDIFSGNFAPLNEEDELSIEYLCCVYEASKEMISFSDENNFLWTRLFGGGNNSRKHCYSSTEMSSLIQTVIKKNIFILEANIYFKKLNMKDKKELLSKNMMEMCQLRGALRFDPKGKTFVWYFNQKEKAIANPTGAVNQLIGEEDLMRFYKSQEVARSVVKTMERIVRVGLNMESILILMHIVIFSIDDLKLEDPIYIQNVQAEYLSLLYRYFMKKMKKPEARGLLCQVVALLTDLRQLCEESKDCEVKDS